MTTTAAPSSGRHADNRGRLIHLLSGRGLALSPSHPGDRAGAQECRLTHPLTHRKPGLKDGPSLKYR